MSKKYYKKIKKLKQIKKLKTKNPNYSSKK